MARLSLLRFESYRSGLIASAAANLLSQAVGFLTIMLFAFYFGAQTATDIYLYCAATLSIAAALVLSLDAAVLVPEFMRITTQQGRERGMHFANVFLFLYALAAGLVSTWIAFHPDQFLGRASQFTPQVIAEHRGLVALLAPLLCGEVVAVYLADLLASQKFFTVPMLSTLANRLIQAVFLVSFHATFGVRSIVFGSLTAYTLQIAALLVLVRVRLGWSFRPDPRAVSRDVWRNAGVALAGNGFSTLAQWAPLYLLTGLGAGVISAANYAYRVLNIPQSFLTTHVSSITGIKLNDLHARQDHAQVDLTFRRATRALIFLLAPLATILCLEAPGVIRMLFQRGSFDENAAAQATLFLRYLALTLPFLGINTIVARIFMAAQRIVPAFWYQAAQNIILVAAVYAGIRWAGPRGYLLATLAFQLWNVLALAPLMAAMFPYIAYRRTLGYLAGMLALCGALGAALVPLHALFAANPYLSLAATGGTFAIFLLLLNERFRVNEDLAGVAGSIWRRVMKGNTP